MKKVLLYTLMLAGIILHVAGVAGAVPSGHILDYEKLRTEGKLIIDKLARNQTITYCTYISEEDLKNKLVTSADLKFQVRLAFQAWTDNVAATIRAAGPEYVAEHEGVLKILSKEPDIRDLGRCNTAAFNSSAFPKTSRDTTADISFIFNTKYCTSGGKLPLFMPEPIAHICLGNFNGYANPFYNFRYEKENSITKNVIDIFDKKISPLEKYKTWVILEDFLLATKKITLAYVITHELGHAFGAGDQDPVGIEKTDVYYATVKPRKGIMSGENVIPGCDDADTIITSINRALGINNSFNSLCKDGIKFKDNREDFTGTKERTVYPAPNVKIIHSLTKGEEEVYKRRTLRTKVDFLNPDIKNYLEKEGFDVAAIRSSSINFAEVLTFNEKGGRMEKTVEYSKSGEKQVITYELDLNNNTTKVEIITFTKFIPKNRRSLLNKNAFSKWPEQKINTSIPEELKDNKYVVPADTIQNFYR
ncbi:hypothetical protein Dip510_001700 [Elusimicrobium posterum]|uniref:hypothetical protein n=1 Tax=Elusimicrobium posterum TaxID=3116653 RepID=UPI003C788FE6